MGRMSGKDIFPPVRQRYRPTCVISWSRQGYENASYCISQTGRQPAMQRPTAPPMIPASANGVSTQRSGPKRSRRPAVARKTPPARPTSSPSTMTFSSRSISVWSASLTASTSVLLGIGVPRDELGVRVRKGLGCGDAHPHGLERVAADLLDELLGQDSEPAEIALVAAEAFVLALELDALCIDVGARVVGGR